MLTLDPDYNMFYFDPSNPALWGSNPPGNKITSLILDPIYPVPARGSTPPVGGSRL
jgi:hypothetical protein